MNEPLNQVREWIGEAGEDAIRAGEWEASQRLFAPAAGRLLTPAAVSDGCRRAAVSAELERALLAALPPAEDESLARLFWHFHYLLFRDPEFPAERVDDWPRLPPEVHPSSLLFYALVFLSGIAQSQRIYGARGIAAALWEDALRRFGETLDAVWRTGREADLVRRWTVYPIVGRLFRLGRLEFLLDEFPYDYHAFRRRGDGRVIVLAGDGMRFRADGQCDGADGVHDAEGGWAAAFAADDRDISGSPISPFGFAVRRKVRLDPGDWEPALGRGDRTVSVHIPATGPMTPDACRASFAEAEGFFPAHFPDAPFAAYTCCSWLMDPQFERCLPAESNIVRFLREYYLLPLPGASDRAVFHWVFRGKPEDLSAAPRETTLQRAILDHAAAGGHWRHAGGMLLRQDCLRGGSVYRRAFRETERGTLSPGTDAVVQ
ncbi:MAG TPA: hypothetical protein VM490_07575 [Armatimonadaceae bacterium]|nr:hypothetical protein [Armatimonadaceae bacterium]